MQPHYSERPDAFLVLCPLPNWVAKGHHVNSDEDHGTNIPSHLTMKRCRHRCLAASCTYIGGGVDRMHFVF